MESGGEGPAAWLPGGPEHRPRRWRELPGAHRRFATPHDGRAVPRARPRWADHRRRSEDRHLGLADAFEALGRPPVLALTATATESAARDVGELLRLPAPLVARVVARTSCERPNLTLSVVRAPSPERKREAPDAILARERGAGIVSTTTVKRADELWGSLCERFGEGIGNLDERPDPGVATRSRTRGGRTRGTAVAIPLER